MKNKNKRIIAAGLVSILLLGTSTLAWFTDRTASNINGLAGNICLNMSDIEADLDNLAPGDDREIKFTYENFGSLAVDTRITYGLTYDLHEDNIELLEGAVDIATLTIGDESMVLNSSEESVVKTFDGETLNGLSEKVGVEKVNEVVKFHLNEELNNAGQQMDFMLEVVIEGKQHRNDPEWEELNTLTIKVANSNTEVVQKSACNVVQVDVSELFIYEYSDDMWNAEYDGYYITGFHPDIKDKIAQSEGAIPSDFMKNPVFPSEYNGVEVAGVAFEAFLGKGIESISLSDSIKEIQGRAFYDNKIKVIDTASVEFIDSESFGMNTIEEIILRNKLQEIEEAPMSINDINTPGDTSLVNKVVIEDGISEEALHSAGGFFDSLHSMSGKDIVIDEFIIGTTAEGKVVKRNTLGESGDISQINSLKISEGVEGIANNAFSDTNVTIKNVNLPDSLTYIDGKAFYGVGLTEIVIPDNVVRLGYSSFEQNDFDYIKIGKSVSVYEDEYIFAPKSDDHKIKLVEFHDDITHLAGDESYPTEEISLVGEATIENIHWPRNLEVIDDGFFSQAKFEKDIDFRDYNLKKIGVDAFASSSGKKMYLPETLEMVDYGALAFDEMDAIILPKNDKATYQVLALSADAIVVPDEFKLFNGGNSNDSIIDTANVIYANLLEGDSWPSSFRGVDFSSYGNSITIKPLSEFK